MESKSIILDQSVYELNKTYVSLLNGMSLNNSNNNNISDIEKQKSAISAETYHTIGKILEILGEKIEKMIPYPNSDEIPEVKIQDEDTFTSGEEIKFYKDFDDTKFNKCKICKKEDNNLYCQKCNLHLCFSCSDKCKNEQHDLIYLSDEEKNSLSYKQKINQIIKIFLGQEEGKLSGENSVLKYYTNDIKFILIIIARNYKNYFNYKNIKEGYEYIEGIYDNSVNNDCLKIKYCFKKYKDKKGKKVKIFGSTFVKNNEKDIYLIIKNKRSTLVSQTILDDINLEVILVQKAKNGDKNLIKNISCMFNGCKSSLIEFSKVDNYELLNLSEVRDISYVFKDCTNLEEIDLSFFDCMYKIENINFLFSNCKKLSQISNFKSLHTEEVTNMDSVFNNCTEIESLKEFNFLAKGVESFNNLFHNCSSLKTLPNINQWDMEYAKTLKGMFSGCQNLKILPDISNWNLENVENMEEMFAGCRIIEKPPDFNKWNLINIKTLDKIFYNSFATKINFKEWKIPNLEIVSKNNILGNNVVEDDED